MRRNKELVFSITRKDFEVTYFSGKGAGGQHRNKHQNCVRLRHRASGVIATGQSHRDRISNTREVFQGLVKNPVFRAWLYDKVHGVDVKRQMLKDAVDKSLTPENLLVEYRINGKWVQVD